MFSLFVKPSELQRWDRYGCSYSRFLNKYYHKAHSSYALLQRHRVHLGQASPPAPGSCWAHKPMRWHHWIPPDVCGAAALLLPRQQARDVRRLLCPSATSYSLGLALVALCSAMSPASSQASVEKWMGHQGGSGFVLRLGIPLWWGNVEFWKNRRNREKNQWNLNVDMDLHQCF